MPDPSQHAVIALFDDSAHAEQVVHDLMGWDEANEDIKLGAIGLLTREENEWGKTEIKTKNFSSRNTRKGAKVGMGLGVLAAVLSGGLTLIPTAVGGAVAGGAVGSLSRTGLGLTNTQVDLLMKRMEIGGAALLVMCDDGDVAATSDYLVGQGGTLQTN